MSEFEVRGPSLERGPECFLCNRPAPRSQSRYSRPICTQCLKFARIRERREAHDKLVAKVKALVVGQGLELKIRGRTRRCVVVRVWFAYPFDAFGSNPTPEVELRYWTTDGEEKTGNFKASILP